MSLRPGRTQFLVECMLALWMATPLSAADVLWNNASGGDFQFGGNWLGGTPPGTSDVAIFDLSSQGYVVTFTGSATTDTLYVQTDVVTFDLNSFTYTLSNNTLVPIAIGPFQGMNGQLNVRNGTLRAAARAIYVGWSGQGSLTLSNGAIAEGNADALGVWAGSNGSATVRDGGSMWNSASFTVGSFGHGALTVSTGGVVSSTQGLVASSEGSSGSVAVRDLGSTWTMPGVLHVGRRGEGDLTISSNGRVESGWGYVATISGSVGSAIVRDSGSIWTISNSLYIAGDLTSMGGSGSLRVRDGGQVSVKDTIKVWPSGMLILFGGGTVGTGGGLDSQGVLAGSGTVVGNVNVSMGAVRPGSSTGILTIDGNYEQNGQGILVIELGGLTPGVQYDRLVVSGSADLDGELRINLVDDFLPIIGQSFEVLQADSISGQFSPDCDTSVFEIGYTPTSVIVTIVSGSLTDCNNNGNDDSCDIASCVNDPSCDDCNSNGVPDLCDINSCLNDPACDDCNFNGIPDSCDLLAGNSLDANMDQIPDECVEFTGDCTTMGVQDYWTCTDNWELGGLYPDNTDSAAGVAVTLPSGSGAFLDETVTIPSLRLLTGAGLRVTQSGGEGDLLFDSPAALQIEGSVLVAGARAVGLGGPQLPNVAVRPGGVYGVETGSIAGAVTATLAAESLRVEGDDCNGPPCTNGGSVDISESMTATVSGKVTIDGRRAVGGACGSELSGAAAGGYTPPVIRIRKNGIVDCADFSMLGAAYLVVDPTTPLTTPLSVGGDFNNQSTRPDCFDARQGGILLNGTAEQVFEVAGTDIGPVGPVDGAEFVIGAVKVAENGRVTFRDDFDNNGLGQAPCDEALYVQHLTLGNASSIVLNDCRVYYETLDQDPSAAITSLGCGGLHLVSTIAAPGADPTGISKGRAITFVPSGGSSVASIGENALRISLDSLHHVNPPYTSGTATDYSALEGQVRWVGPPTQYVESASSGTPFYASQLQCDPYYQDWSTVGLLHLFGSAIVPSSVYEVENLAASCQGDEAGCAAVSAPLSIVTTRWGDVVEPFNPPSTTSQPDFADIGALVNKFKSAAGAPIKARALLAGTNANGDIDPTPDLGFTHISACVDAFKGLPYPYTIASCP